ncbi:DegT/DnrJ/EryC1/StrS family aminotransferase [Sediminibacterium ginsengisoli]|uniref:dTDP-4-amino-4,6-dideoxygalactose transaminase n=1 Tax=Sediminibacterium ginsengisoli TaxID=413434 RepID=A0A1T4RMM2_9BACT|nr:DegT/DnrJ/EryC1/StrS family aminotransferase [Sediminibacterium ginsengisoli]SKA17234.1 dTDP-4-amino-4,6-dideoxygalactose transaminase [Sediminibacterium ginsengisoli]
MRIPYENIALVNAPYRKALTEKFDALLERGWFILGDEVTGFEQAFAHYTGNVYCTGVGNGLDALIFSLLALKLPAGSEVIVPSNTYIATILAVIHAGLVPVLAEPDPSTYNLTAEGIENVRTSKTRAVLLAHLYGKCCSMTAIMALAERYGLAVIEDCAQSHGAMYKGQPAGSFGTAAAFSFYPTKNLGALGDGGAVVTNDPALDQHVRLLRNYGSGKKYHNQIPGWNSRLDEIQAAFLQIKLQSLNEMNRHKQELAAIYRAGLNSSFILPVEEPDHSDVYHIFAIRHPDRDKLRAYLAENGIGTEVHYPVPPHRQQALAAYFTGQEFPVSEEIHRTVLSLPCSAAHTQEQVREVAELMNRFGK